MRRWLIGSCVVSVAAMLATAYSLRIEPRAAAERPNVVLYLVDTLRADHLGIYGYPRDTSPVLDEWARETVIFDRAYSPSSWTKSATVSLLSGLDPLNHRVENRLSLIPPEVRLLSERLKERGYHTFAVVTNPNVLPLWGFDRGFDVYQDLDSVGRGTRADAVMDWVTERIPRLAQEQPFFLYVHLLDPHDPYEPPPPFDTRFADEAAPPRAKRIAAYDGEIAFGDSQFRRLLDTLKTRDLYEDTLLVFAADHGEELRDHGAWGHGQSLHQEVVRVPLLIKFPGSAHAGSRMRTLVSLIDVVPTVMSVLGRPLPPDLDGRDLTQLLGEDEPAWTNRDLFFSLDLAWPERRAHLVRGVSNGSQKYLRRAQPIEGEALFDVERDPNETQNLAGVHVEARERLAATLDRYVATKTSGIHLRILNTLTRRPVECKAVLHTTGRFVEVSGSLLEKGDRLEISDDGRSLRLRCVLETRPHPTGGAPRALADADGLVFGVSPPTAPIVVAELSLKEDRELPLRVGADRRIEALPFRFDAAEPDLAVRDIEELLREAGTPPRREAMGAYLAVVSPPSEREEVPDDVQDRLRALGYLDEATEAE